MVRDLDKVAAELKAKGVEFTRDPVTPRRGIRICFIRGPQGTSIELLESDPNTFDGTACVRPYELARSFDR